MTPSSAGGELGDHGAVRRPRVSKGLRPVCHPAPSPSHRTRGGGGFEELHFQRGSDCVTLFTVAPTPARREREESCSDWIWHRSVPAAGGAAAGKRALCSFALLGCWLRCSRVAPLSIICSEHCPITRTLVPQLSCSVPVLSAANGPGAAAGPSTSGTLKILALKCVMEERKAALFIFLKLF